MTSNLPVVLVSRELSEVVDVEIFSLVLLDGVMTWLSDGTLVVSVAITTLDPSKKTGK